MGKNEDEILISRLGALGASGGLGGAAGAKFAAKRLKTLSHQVDIDVGESAKHVLEVAAAVLRQDGQLIDDPSPQSGSQTLCALTGSGFFKLNPTLVKVSVVPLGLNESRVSIHALAKEGLIKQRSAEKAARRLASVLAKTSSLGTAAGTEERK